jgi:hypothetical protein
MKIFCTKYALTKGIEELQAEKCGNNMVRVEAEWSYYLHGEGKEWHSTLESAIKKAEEMKLKRIASLKKSLNKLECMRFD